ncbi:hypothetical protein KW796_00630 [Candidatus Parcubacteria bacterium]|nr:hypothetical protein [Candidatus Parcubacteria bacterium]
MKTTFRRRYNGGEKNFSKRTLYVIAALGAGIAVFYFLRSPILNAISPVWRGQNSITRGISNFLGLIKDKDSLARDNLALREKLASYELLLAENRALSASRDELLGKFGREESTAGIAAGVLVHPPETPYDNLIIDAGEVEGVKMDSRVSLPEGGALGTISEVHEHQSKVALYSGSSIETGGLLERGNIPVTLVGAGGGTFKLTLPRDVIVEAGDKILLPGIRSELVGVVREVSLEPTDSEKHVTVGAVANIHGIRFVNVH